MRSSREARIERIRRNELIRRQVSQQHDSITRGRSRFREPRNRRSPSSTSPKPTRKESRITSPDGIERLDHISPYSAASYPLCREPRLKDHNGRATESTPPRRRGPDIVNPECSVTSQLLKTIKAKNSPRPKYIPVTCNLVGAGFPTRTSPTADSSKKTRNVSTRKEYGVQTAQAAIGRKHISQPTPSVIKKNTSKPSSNSLKPISSQPHLNESSNANENNHTAISESAVARTPIRISDWKATASSGPPPYEVLLAAARGEQMYRFANYRSSEPRTDVVDQDQQPKQFQSVWEDDMSVPPSPSPPSSPIVLHTIQPKAVAQDRHVVFDLEEEKEHRFSVPDFVEERLPGALCAQSSNKLPPNTFSQTFLEKEIQQSESISMVSSITTTPDRNVGFGRVNASSAFRHRCLGDGSPESQDLDIVTKGSNESLQHLLGSYPGAQTKSSSMKVSSASPIEQILEEPTSQDQVLNAPNPGTKATVSVRSSDSESTSSSQFGQGFQESTTASNVPVRPVATKVRRKVHDPVATKASHEVNDASKNERRPVDSFSSNNTGRVLRIFPHHSCDANRGATNVTGVTLVGVSDSPFRHPIDSDSSSPAHSGRVPNEARTASQQNGAMKAAEGKKTPSRYQRAIDSDSSKSSNSGRIRQSATNGDTITGDDDHREKDKVLLSEPKFRVTIIKESPTDKIGVHVGRRLTNRGYQLVVSKISPTSPLVDSPMDVGDIVLSINGVNLQINPETSAALDLVQNSKERVTFLLRRPDDFDLAPDLRLPALPHDDVSEQGPVVVAPSGLRKQSWDEDGSVTISLEEVDEAGSVKNRRVEKKMINPDGSITMSMDEQSLSGSAVQVSYNESINISGIMSITVAKESREQKVGLRIVTREGPMGRALFVGSIDPSGLFANTPLREGDIILSVNSTSFRRNSDAGKASSIIRNVENDLTIVARKSDRSLQDFLGRKFSGVGHHTAPKDKEATFEGSYGAVLGGYNSTFKVKVTKKDISDLVGLTMVTQRNNLGMFIVVSKVSPSGLFAESALQEGDIILSVNGVDLKEDPDITRAAAIFQDAPDDIFIECQRMSGLQPVLLPEESRPKKMQVTQTLLPDGQKVVKTETFNVDGTTTVKVEKFSPPCKVHVPLQRSNSDVSGIASLDMSEISGLDTASFDDGLLRRRPELDAGGGIRWGSEIEGGPARCRADSETFQPSHVCLPEVDAKGSKPKILTVYKSYPSQEVGLSLTTVRGTLRVTKISPTGLFAGKPLLPGDTILSINSITFRDQPDVKTAKILMDNAKEEIRVEVLSTANSKGKDIQGKRKLWNPELFFGTRRLKRNSKSWKGISFRRGRASKSSQQTKREEPQTTPDTSFEAPDTGFEEGYC